MVDFSRGACIASFIKSISIRSLFRVKTCTKKEQVKYCRVAFFSHLHSSKGWHS